MGLVSLRTAALSVLGISSLVFIALFGRLPIFRYAIDVFFVLLLQCIDAKLESRRTPIGFLHRLLWIHIPHGFARLDSILLGGRLVPCCKSFGRYIAYDNHPLVLVSRVGSILLVCFPLIVSIGLLPSTFVDIRIDVCAKSMAETKYNA